MVKLTAPCSLLRPVRNQEIQQLRFEYRSVKYNFVAWNQPSYPVVPERGGGQGGSCPPSLLPGGGRGAAAPNDLLPRGARGAVLPFAFQYDSNEANAC